MKYDRPSIQDSVDLAAELGTDKVFSIRKKLPK
jgi:hypothetical protein